MSRSFLHSISTVVVGIEFTPGTASAQQQSSDDMKASFYGDAAVVPGAKFTPARTYKGEPFKDHHCGLRNDGWLRQ